MARKDQSFISALATSKALQKGLETIDEKRTRLSDEEMVSRVIGALKTAHQVESQLLQWLEDATEMEASVVRQVAGRSFDLPAAEMETLRQLSRSMGLDPNSVLGGRDVGCGCDDEPPSKKRRSLPAEDFIF